MSYQELELKDVKISNVLADLEKTALVYGPMVLCLEGNDNYNSLSSLLLDSNGEFKVKVDKDNDYYVMVEASGLKVTTDDKLYSFNKPKYDRVSLTFIPYHTWANREASDMRVWINEK